MGIDIKDLPYKAQVQALQKLQEQEARRARKGCASLVVLENRDEHREKGRKFHNKPTERVTASGEIIRFDSQKEARRFDQLLPLLEAGKIRDLRLQAQFTLQEGYTTAGGVKVRPIRYVADFAYERETEPDKTGKTYWIRTVEDVKSKATKTRVYELKKKLMREKFNIEVQEV